MRELDYWSYVMALSTSVENCVVEIEQGLCFLLENGIHFGFDTIFDGPYSTSVWFMLFLVC